MIHFMKKIVLLLSCFLILSCTAAYRPYKNKQGYVVLPLAEKQFRIEYYSDNPNANIANWHTAAKQLCAGEPVIESEQSEIWGLKSGVRVNLKQIKKLQGGSMARLNRLCPVGIAQHIIQDVKGDGGIVCREKM